MKLKTLQSELHRLDLMVGAWQRKEDITTIERDLLLARLRDIYAAVCFDLEEDEPQCEDAASMPLVVPPIEAEPIEEEPLVLDADDFFSFDPIAPVMAESVDEILPASEDLIPEEESASEVVEAEAQQFMEDPIEPEVMVELEEKADLDTEAELEIEAVVEPEMAEIEGVIEPEAEKEEQRAEEIEPALASHEEVAQDELPAVEAIIEPEQPEERHEEPIAAPVESPRPTQTLFGDEPVVDHHRRKQRVIMSLYDVVEPEPIVEEPAASWMPATDEVVDAGEENGVIEISEEELEQIPRVTTVSATKEAELEPDWEEDVEQISEEELVAKPTPRVKVEEAPAILGEKIQPRQTLADALAEQQSVNDFRPRVTDLRRAVGLNDKFLLIRDLFGGNGSLYEITIRRLNEFDNFDDCMIYIAEHFAWNPNSDGAKLMMDLLERKFDQQ